MPTTAVIIPVLNEEESLPKVLGDLPVELVVGDADETAAVARVTVHAACKILKTSLGYRVRLPRWRVPHGCVAVTIPGPARCSDPRVAR